MNAINLLLVITLTLIIFYSTAIKFENEDSEEPRMSDAELGLSELMKTVKSPELLAETLEMLKDPEIAAEVQALMQNPEFQREMKAYTESQAFKAAMSKSEETVEALSQDPVKVKQFEQKFSEAFKN